jgi:peroxiredoxin Q/BCP
MAYFMASVDDPETNKKFGAENDADFPLLSDPGKQTARAYGVVDDKRAFAARWTFYIRPDGKLGKIDRQVRPPTAAEDMIAALSELGVARK